MAENVLLNVPEISMQVENLKAAYNALEETASMSKRVMRSISDSWLGDSGRSFASAAERINAGFVKSGNGLEQMINDVTAAVGYLTAQDAATAESVASSAGK